MRPLRPHDQRDLMERAFVSLATTRRTAPIDHRAGSVHVRVETDGSHGLATIWDADVLIFAVSELVAARDRGRRLSPWIDLVPHRFLAFAGRDRGSAGYRRLHAALARLHATRVATSIRASALEPEASFRLIEGWGPSIEGSGLLVLVPDWLVAGVADRSLALAIDPAYFGLRGGIERWLYRVARKHAGHQPDGWTATLPLLHAKSGSLARPSDFAADLRRIVRAQPLPGYRLDLLRQGALDAVRIRPVTPRHAGGQNAV